MRYKKLVISQTKKGKPYYYFKKTAKMSDPNAAYWIEGRKVKRTSFCPIPYQFWLEYKGIEYTDYDEILTVVERLVLQYQRNKSLSKLL